MKLSPCAIFLYLSACSHGYLIPVSQRTSGEVSRSFSLSELQSSTTRDDAAFSAFANSLEEDPEIPSSKAKVKPWQSKLEDLLDPKTNAADRQVLLSELLNSNDQIRESVMDALASKKVRNSVLL